MTLVPWWSILLCVAGCQGHVYKNGGSWNGYEFHTYPHPAKKPVVPRETMVDTINNLGIKLLAIHNEYNENNIAISPYGALSVLIALGEGLVGDAAYEIQQAAHLPNDISITRVGLRDIHRHLKSYFIPKEGFLAGLTLNHENVTLRPEYEEILKFYGYDIVSFNNALYPQPETTERPQTTFKSEVATTTQPTTTENIAATDMAKTEPVDQTTSTPSIIIATSTQMVTTTDAMTTTKPDTTTLTRESTQSTQVVTTTNAETTVMPEISTTEQVATTLQDLSTSTILPRTTATIEPKALETTSSMPPTTTVEIVTERTTTEPSITETIEAETTLSSRTTESAVEDTTLYSSKTTREIPPTTVIITTEIMTTTTSSSAEADTTQFSGAEETTSLRPTEGVSFVDTTLSTLIPSTESVTAMPTTDIENINDTDDENTSTTTTNVLSTDSSAVMTTKDSKDNEIESTEASTEEEGFGGTIKRKTRDDQDAPKLLNVVELNMSEKTRPKDSYNSKRNSRSILDYFIARHYDDHYFLHHRHQRPYVPKEGPTFPRPYLPKEVPTFPRPYVPKEEPTFLVYGKYREFNINFMKYDAVLPFYYAPHLNALALSFPLDSTKYYLLLLLPIEETGIDKLVCDLRLNGSLKYIIENMRYTHVLATIPSFNLKGYVTLTPSFQKLGIRKVFEPRQADFTPMTNQKQIYVTNIEQAITVTIRNYVDPDTIHHHRNLHQYDPVHFKASHPFLYFVIDTEIHVTLMAGKIVNPLNSRIS
ncbi:hypothetical protein NQ318_008914 [Aromia moschata]|uniref:Serpin domain-containing protein n=1 Tax=Aromia moschata TaxID=1265417 RepID=A0AAV8ZBD1_9CUCU|nr:hypothetical protein NQ318_008914 [Aromia moschata]